MDRLMQAIPVFALAVALAGCAPTSPGASSSSAPATQAAPKVLNIVGNEPIVIGNFPGVRGGGGGREGRYGGRRWEGRHPQTRGKMSTKGVLPHFPGC